MNYKSKSKALFVALCSLLLIGCDGTLTETEPIEINTVISTLRTGFTVTGSVTVTKSYYEDSNYTIPDEEVATTTTTYTYTLVYQNDEDYTGVDRRFYQLVDGESEYLFGENSFDLDGYVGIRYLDYDNTLETTYGVDEDGELAIYALNGLMNPFELVQRNDFKSQSDGTFELSTTKAAVFYGAMFSVLDDYLDAVSFEKANFVFSEDSLSEAHFTSYNVDSTIATTVSTATTNYHNAYVRYNYQADLYFSEIGTSNAEDMIAVEPEKEENEPLAEALSVMKNSNGFTYRRRSTPYTDGEYAGQDEVVTIYYSQNGANLTATTTGLPYIYSQTYTLTDPTYETYNPTSASTADFMLYNPTSRTDVLYSYEVDDSTVGTTNTFSQSGSSSDFYYLSGYYTYDYLFWLQNFADSWDMDANIFNINEDGSYSPTLDNLQYIASDCFMAPLDVYSPISGGYVTDIRVYVTYDETLESYVFDEIVVDYNQSNMYTGQVVFEYYDFDASAPGFEFAIA